MRILLSEDLQKHETEKQSFPITEKYKSLTKDLQKSLTKRLIAFEMDWFLTFVNPEYIDKADYGNSETSLISVDFIFLYRITKAVLLPPCLPHPLSLQDSSETF